MRLAELAQLRDPRCAEIVGSVGPQWHVVEVFASAQAQVATELAQRRFGIYVPEIEETIVKRGRKFDRRVPMFSGYVFVCMWFSDQHWQWITDTEGVVGVVGALTDEEIDIVRRIENRERPIFIEIPPADPEPVQRRPKKKRRWKNRKSDKAKAKAAKPKLITEADLRAEIITTRAWSAFDDVIELDSDGRNQTLRKALGLS
jgi:transcription antitermination factor NusG